MMALYLLLLLSLAHHHHDGALLAANVCHGMYNFMTSCDDGPMMVKMISKILQPHLQNETPDRKKKSYLPGYSIFIVFL